MKALRCNSKNNQYMLTSYKAMFKWHGFMWKTSEAALQCAKTRTDEEFKFHANKMRMYGAEAAKRYADVKIYTRDDWLDVQEQMLLSITMEKFKYNQSIAEQLLATGNLYILYDTTDTHDNILGRCDCKACAKKRAENGFGNVLMLTRAMCRHEEKCIIEFEDKNGNQYVADLRDYNSIQAVTRKMGVKTWFDVVRNIV